MVQKGGQQANASGGTSLADIERLERELREQLRALDKQKQDALSKSAVEFYERLREELPNFVPYLTDSQRRKLAGMLVGQDDGSTSTEPRSRGIKKGEKLPPKYQFDSGETWTGRGRMSKAFAALADEWKATKGDEPLPAYPNPKAPNR